ncbi:uncharacterized protein LOC105193868 isoform X3 [Solenopsis invicta]|nr:uncharacterized protein LOC105193868 isoform X3 [Solenopsis invicta]XP_025991000.1 uncharacterized protein LOC105193868 isoform X3 [Solenopsis invicta]XP_039314648.1 uncharacterized protein LOC105193868 isoform X3 [Solenopsis invicta]
MDELPKLFRLPGTIEEEEKEEQQRGREAKESLDSATESLLLGQKSVSTLSTLPRNVTLIRVSTQSSSIAGGIGRQDSTRSRYRAGPTRKLRRRAVLKNGDCNVLQSRISRRSLRFLQDIFTTLVDTQWRWTLLCFILSFLLSWLGFAVIWWLIAFTHGDFEEHHLPPFQIENNWIPCVLNIASFTSCFLFSIETQHTIGYGSRSTTEECPEAIFIMCLQSISGVMIQAFMVGIVFAKMTRPKQRTQTLLFSRNAVICQRDGELCLMFRVGDMRKSHIIGASVRAQMIRSKTTKEGEVLSQHQHELVVGTDGENGDLFFIWPATIIHRINESSPFFNTSAEDMLTERFEVVLILEGTIESTGQTTQARTSYLPQEILWGHRFDPMVSYSKERQGYEVDYSLFNSTTQVDTPLCSGKELAEFYKAQDDLRHGTGVLINEDHLIRRECDCNCHLTNHQCLHLSLMHLDSTRSHNSMENEYYWQNICKCSNCIVSYKPQTASVNRSKMFDFDTIQVMENEEMQQLPEAVNKEIVKNSQVIVFEEEDKVSDRNFIRLNDVKSKFLNCNEKISFKEGKEVLMQTATEKDMIDEQNKKSNQEVHGAEKNDASMRTNLIRLNKDKDNIFKGSQKILFKQGKRDFLKSYKIGLKEDNTNILKNRQDIMYEDTKGNFLKRNMIWSNEKDANNFKHCREAVFKEEEGTIKKKLIKLDEKNDNIFKNHHIYKEEQLALIKHKENSEDVRHLIRRTLFKPKRKCKTRNSKFAKKKIYLGKRQRLHNKKFQMITLANQNQKNTENISMKKKPKLKEKMVRSLSDDLSIINDKTFFKESIQSKNNKLIESIDQYTKNSKSNPFSIEKHNSSMKRQRSFTDYLVTTESRKSKESATKNMRDIRILEKDQESLQQIPKYPVTSLNHLNSNTIFSQQLNYDFFRLKNDDLQVKQYDNIASIKIENEKTMRKSSLHHVAKRAMQNKLYSNNICSMVSPVYDISSSFCKIIKSDNCRELFTKNILKDVETTDSVDINLSRENIISDTDSPKECIKDHIVESVISINNSIRNDETLASSRFNTSFINTIDDENNVTKDTSIIVKQIICSENEGHIDEVKKIYRCPNTSFEKLINNFDESEKSSSIVDK